MGHYEDEIYEIYEKVRMGELVIEFNKQLAKMEKQKKHKFKNAKERWEYAYSKVSKSK
tara:strand:- start:330 stop:503 length:174 start_codon:yes stop_codon:yes gene_type:complete